MAKSVTLNKNPLLQFQAWFRDAVQNAAQSGSKYPDAMTLATVSAKGAPSARIVLYKGMNPEGLKFYTNYNSRKGKELLANPRAAVLFYWPELNRQLRIEGRIKKLSTSESDDYWLTRPLESRINAVASPQSRPISGRAVLLQRVKELSLKYGPGLGGRDFASFLPGSLPSFLPGSFPGFGETTGIPRPKHWGGYCLIPDRFEFWIEGQFRLHDRFEYRKTQGKWKQVRLAP